MAGGSPGTGLVFGISLRDSKRTGCWMNVKRGDIVLANLEPVMGSEQGKIRPCLVVQNDVGNKFSSTTIIVPLTSTIPDKNYPTTVIVGPQESGLKEKSAILSNQIRTISRGDRIIKILSSLKPQTMVQVNNALKASLALE